MTDLHTLAARALEARDRYGWSPEADEALGNLRAALAAQPSQAPTAAPVAWRDHVEHRLRTWKQRTMNRSGDRLALDDYMDSESLEDLIDFVCDEYAALRPAPADSVTVPAGLAKSDAEFWLRHRAAIIEACRAAGLTIVSNASGVQLMRLGKIEAQAATPAPAAGDERAAFEHAWAFEACMAGPKATAWTAWQARAARSQSLEPAGWAVYWGLPPNRKHSIHFERATAEEAAAVIKSDTRIVPLVASPGGGDGK